MNTRLSIGNLNNRPSKVERLMSRLDDPEYSYTSMKGRVISMDSKDLVYGEGTRGSFETMHRAASLDDGTSQTLVLFNRQVVLRLNVGDELWVIGTPGAVGRFHAMAVAIPSLQMYADLTSESGLLGSIKFHVLISAIIGLVGYFLSAQAEGYAELSQYFLGLSLMGVSGLLLTTGICLKLMCGISEVRGYRVNSGDWDIIRRAFDNHNLRVQGSDF